MAHDDMGYSKARLTSALRSVAALSLMLIVVLLSSTCSMLNPRASSSGLKPGVNYMQPQKWRMTLTYRVQEIIPQIRLRDERPSKLNPSIPAVGKGTYEAWLVGPREGEEVRGVKLVSANPQPAAIKQGKDTDVSFYYYDFAPDGYLPRDLTATLTFEYTTFERYTYWEGIEYAAYDKESELYKQHTKQEKPIIFDKLLAKEVKTFFPEGEPNNVREVASKCYNKLLSEYTYDLDAPGLAAFYGQEAMTDSDKAWTRRKGVCDEISNCYVMMLRSAGIPARSCAGYTFSGDLSPVGGHAWTEFYIEGTGWVPCDVTWGNDTKIIEKETSPLGFARQIPTADYYFGKLPPYRVTLYKDWNYTLNPAPKTPKAKKSESVMYLATERSSGVRDIKYGYGMTEGLSKCCVLGWARSADMAGSNELLEIELIGKPSKEELAEYVKQIEAEGGHYLNVPDVRRQYPVLIGDGG